MYSWNTCEFSRMGGGPAATEAAFPTSCFPLMFLKAFTHLLFMLPPLEVESLRSMALGVGKVQLF